MQTRRRVKSAAAAAAAAGDDHESASQAGSVEPPIARVLHIDMPADPDLEQLAELIPDIDPSTVTSENVLALYRLLVYYASDLSATQREFEQAQADGERKDVELEQALQDRETAQKEFQVTIEQQQAEVTQLKQERDQLGKHGWHESMQTYSQTTFSSRFSDCLTSTVNNVEHHPVNLCQRGSASKAASRRS
jgi:nucleoprotein TPR